MTFDVWDGLAAAGAALATAGIWMMNPPVALIVLGTGLVAFGFWGSR